MFDEIISGWDHCDLNYKTEELKGLLSDTRDFKSYFEVFECLAVIWDRHFKELRSMPYIGNLARSCYLVIHEYYYGYEETFYNNLNEFIKSAYDYSVRYKRLGYEQILGDLYYKVSCIVDKESFTEFCSELRRRASIRSRLSNDIILASKLSDETANLLPYYYNDEEREDYNKSTNIMMRAAETTSINKSSITLANDTMFNLLKKQSNEYIYGSLFYAIHYYKISECVDTLSALRKNPDDNTGHRKFENVIKFLNDIATEHCNEIFFENDTMLAFLQEVSHLYSLSGRVEIPWVSIDEAFHKFNVALKSVYLAIWNDDVSVTKYPDGLKKVVKLFYYVLTETEHWKNYLKIVLLPKCGDY